VSLVSPERDPCGGFRPCPHSAKLHACLSSEYPQPRGCQFSLPAGRQASSILNLEEPLGPLLYLVTPIGSVRLHMGVLTLVETHGIFALEVHRSVLCQGHPPFVHLTKRERHNLQF